MYWNWLASIWKCCSPGAAKAIGLGTPTIANANNPIAIQRIEESPLDEVVVTNSIPASKESRRSTKIRYLSIARLLAEAIRRIDANDSVSSLFV